MGCLLRLLRDGDTVAIPSDGFLAHLCTFDMLQTRAASRAHLAAWDPLLRDQDRHPHQQLERKCEEENQLCEFDDVVAIVFGASSCPSKSSTCGSPGTCGPSSTLASTWAGADEVSASPSAGCDGDTVAITSDGFLAHLCTFDIVQTRCASRAHLAAWDPLLRDHGMHPHQLLERKCDEEDLLCEFDDFADP